MASIETRHWITNPGGHRRHDRDLAPTEGTIVETVFGPAAAIGSFIPTSDDFWVCDLCSEQILTLWGGEPFPVKADGGYAFCHECARHVEVTYGPWPNRVCGCPACKAQVLRIGFALIGRG